MPARQAAALTLALFVVACGESAPPKPVVLLSSAARTARASSAPPPPLRVIEFEQASIDPKAAEALVEHFGDPPAAIDEHDAPPLTKEALEDTARSEARGLALEGGVHVAELAEGRRAVISVDVQTGDCVTAIAHGGLGVMEVDAFVVEHGSAPPRILAQDTKTGPMAVVGGLAGCYPYVGAGPSTLDVLVLARKGSGPVVFAAYRSRP
jgi:hypothetical protein